MGFYIETNTIKNKANEILKQHPSSKEVDLIGARTALVNGEGVICVVENLAGFDAAGFCYDLNEFKVFSNPDDMRLKRWIVMDRKLAEKLSGYSE